LTVNNCLGLAAVCNGKVKNRVGGGLASALFLTWLRETTLLTRCKSLIRVSPKRLSSRSTRQSYLLLNESGGILKSQFEN
jgi:hypothetical protein